MCMQTSLISVLSCLVQVSCCTTGTVSVGASPTQPNCYFVSYNKLVKEEFLACKHLLLAFTSMFQVILC